MPLFCFQTVYLFLRPRVYTRELTVTAVHCTTKIARVASHSMPTGPGDIIKPPQRLAAGMSAGAALLLTQHYAHKHLCQRNLRC